MPEIKYQNQAFLSRKEPRQIGDCLRTTIANLLGLDRDSVPHFVQEAEGGFCDCMKRVNAFLRPYGLVYMLVETKTEEFKWFGIEGLHHVGYGQTCRNTRHAVSGKDREMIHDPHPDKDGLELMDDKIGVFVALRPWEKL
jgi:hypothetical protein